MNYKYLMVMVVAFGIGLGLSQLPINSEAEEDGIIIFEHKNKIKNFKVFEDGVTYRETERFGGDTYISIIHDNIEYDCIGLGYHLSPVCVEIIMRSLP